MGRNPQVPQYDEDQILFYGATPRSPLTVTTVGDITLTGDPKRIRRPVAGAIGILRITDAQTLATDTLDVFVQTRIGDVWIDVIHFKQVLGNGADSLEYVAKLSGTNVNGMFKTSDTLIAEAVQHIIGDEWRARYEIATLTTAVFSFNVWIAPIG